MHLIDGGPITALKHRICSVVDLVLRDAARHFHSDFGALLYCYRTHDMRALLAEAAAANTTRSYASALRYWHRARFVSS